MEMKSHTLAVIAAKLTRHNKLHRDGLIKLFKYATRPRSELLVAPKTQFVIPYFTQLFTDGHYGRHVSARAAADRQDLCHRPLLPSMVCVLYMLIIETPSPMPPR